MTAKNFLNQCYQIDKLIACDRNLIKKLEGLKAVGFDEKVQTSAKNSNEERNLKICELQEEIRAEINRLIETVKAVKDEIAKIEDKDEKLILTMRYIEYAKWEKIAERMNYSLMQIYRIHNSALEHVEINLKKQNSIDC